MAWQAYRVVWRLRSPLHIGHSKVGNVQRTRPYVTGRVLWGALTQRLAQDSHAPPDYAGMGQAVHEHLAFSYFYPALRADDGQGWSIQWPWGDPAGAGVPFYARLMGSYASTALVYPHHSAQEGSLHEVEFLSPRTLNDSESADPVYLIGTMFATPDAPAGWPAALTRLQIGGERGYGWGRLERVALDALPGTPTLWDHDLKLDGARPVVTLRDGARPVVTLRDGARLLAHTAVDGVDARGEVEPLVGRAWGARGAGQKVEHLGVCYAPGAVVNVAADAEIHLRIGPYGLWMQA